MSLRSNRSVFDLLSLCVFTGKPLSYDPDVDSPLSQNHVDLTHNLFHEFVHYIHSLGTTHGILTTLFKFHALIPLNLRVRSMAEEGQPIILPFTHHLNRYRGYEHSPLTAEDVRGYRNKYGTNFDHILWNAYKVGQVLEKLSGTDVWPVNLQLDRITDWSLEIEHHQIGRYGYDTPTVILQDYDGKEQRLNIGSVQVFESYAHSLANNIFLNHFLGKTILSSMAGSQADLFANYCELQEASNIISSLNDRLRIRVSNTSYYLLNRLLYLHISKFDKNHRLDYFKDSLEKITEKLFKPFLYLAMMQSGLTTKETSFLLRFPTQDNPFYGFDQYDHEMALIGSPCLFFLQMVLSIDKLLDRFRCNNILIKTINIVNNIPDILGWPQVSTTIDATIDFLEQVKRNTHISFNFFFDTGFFIDMSIQLLRYQDKNMIEFINGYFPLDMIPLPLFIGGDIVGWKNRNEAQEKLLGWASYIQQFMYSKYIYCVMRKHFSYFDRNTEFCNNYLQCDLSKPLDYNKCNDLHKSLLALFFDNYDMLKSNEH